jgi:hypothetical protein
MGDESQIDDLEGKRFYVQTYEMKLQGYIVDSEEFDVKPAVTRAFVSFEVGDKKPKPIFKIIKDETENDKTLKVIVQFLPGSFTEITLSLDSSSQITSIQPENVITYTILKNGSPVTLPFTANENDSIFISIVKDDTTKFSEIILRGLVIV